MKKEMLILFLLILISLILIGCAQKQITEEDEHLFDAILASATTVDACNYLESESLTARCIDEYNIQSASNENDKSYCNIVSKKKKTECLDKYLKNLAMFNKDTGVCNEITDPEIKQNCIDETSRHSSLEDTYKLAVDTEDVTKCDVLSGDDINECKDRYYFIMAYNTKDKSYCDSIINTITKDSCKK